jgi:signal transduction histidine kinase/DNA-binding response OmpR family regulator/ligand-binding sensor domain-containing protein
LAGEHFVFTHISSNDGLSENRVRVLCQLPDGRMVIVTEGLVNIYDGASFHYIHFNDENAYPLENYSGFHHAYIDNEGHLWIKNNKKILLFDITKETFVPDIGKLLSVQGLEQKVTDFFMDSYKDFWYLTENDQLIYRNSKEKKNIIFLKDASKNNNIKDELYDIAVSEEYVFLFYKSGIMSCLNKQTHKEIYRINPFSGKNNNLVLNTLMVVPDKHYLYTLHNSNKGGFMLRFHTKNKKWDIVLQTDYWLNTLTVDNKGSIWVSCAKGLWHINEKLQEKQFISKLQLVDGNTFETEISTQYNDDKGGLWIGTLDRGILYYHPERFKFRNFGRTLFKDSDGGELRILSLSEFNGNIFIGTSKGLFIYPQNAQTISKYQGIPENIRCNMLFKDSQSRIWLCAGNDGLFAIEKRNIRHYQVPVSCQYLTEMSSEQLLVCSNQGLGIFETQSGKYQSLNVKGPKITNIYQLAKYNKDTLIGISASGPFIFDYNKNIISTHETDLQGKSSIFQHSNHQYNCIFIDSRKLVWVGTQDGLNVWDAASKRNRVFFMEDGLVNNCIQSIIEDNQHRIWVSTSNGISRLDINKKAGGYHFSFQNYNSFDGIIKNEFMRRAVCKTTDNRLLWGGLDGLNEIDLNIIDSTSLQLSVPLFTRFFLSGTEIKHGELYNGKVILQQSIAFTKEIRLNHSQNFISFEFSALNYINPAQTYYRYKLEGVDNSWHEIKTTDGIGRAGYTNLSPGNYRLRVGATNNNGEWNGKFAEIRIIIYPPFWKTPLAYIIYVLLFLSALFLSVFYYTRWSRIKMQRQQKEELDQIKYSFFTNISHELRTPLTLILTPLDAIIKKTGDEQLKTQLNGIYRNARELLKLVNQLLDFRKLEIKGESLQLSYCNIGEFLETIITPFREISSDKKIKFNWECTEHNLNAYIDKDKIQKILNNLLSNAYKFTHKGGSISVQLNKSTLNNSEIPFLKIQVTDTGCGIPEKELPRIFDRFYQVKNNNNPNTGSGIGLHLAKEYVQLHNGQIYAESLVNKGSIFTVYIPANLHPVNENDVAPEKKNNNHSIKLLVVEDNEEFRAFLYNELSENYQVILTSNGQEGFDKALEYQPDLIISDVMMPIMSGIEMCQKLKTDVRISHIPVIMLTAKASDKAQIEAFQASADAYITKPFNMEILQLRIHHLLEQQEERKNLYKKAIIINPGSLTSTNVDEEFIKKAIGFIEKNISNPSYLVEELSRDMCMDRTGLYRKLIAIVGQKPSSFIRSVRLKRAAQLLGNGTPVSEVAETVGYGTASYFSRCFSEEFGVKPSEYKGE